MILFEFENVTMQCSRGLIVCRSAEAACLSRNGENSTLYKPVEWLLEYIFRRPSLL